MRDKRWESELGFKQHTSYLLLIICATSTPFIWCDECSARSLGGCVPLPPGFDKTSQHPENISFPQIQPPALEVFAQEWACEDFGSVHGAGFSSFLEFPQASAPCTFISAYYSAPYEDIAGQPSLFACIILRICIIYSLTTCCPIISCRAMLRLA